jgi:hypothetical protein
MCVTVSAVLASSASAAPITINGVLGSASSPDWPKTTGNMLDRPNSSLTTTAACGTEGTFSDFLSAQHFVYDAYTFYNPFASTACVTVSVMNTSTETSAGAIMAIAYKPSFNPNSIGTNWWAGENGSIVTGTTKTFSFNVTAHTNFVVVVNARNGNEGGGPLCTGPCTYVLTVDSNLGPPTAVTMLANSSARRTPLGALVRWRTATEANQLGFNVFREVSGKRVRANRTLLPSVFGGTVRGHAYSFLDRKAPQAVKLRYWIQNVWRNGTRTWSGPIALS